METQWVSFVGSKDWNIEYWTIYIDLVALNIKNKNPPKCNAPTDCAKLSVTFQVKFSKYSISFLYPMLKIFTFDSYAWPFLLNALPCLQYIFTRRTSGHWFGTFRTVKLYVLLQLMQCLSQSSPQAKFLSSYYSVFFRAYRCVRFSLWNMVTHLFCLMPVSAR